MNHAQKLQLLTETIADALVDVDLLSDSIDTHDLVTLIQTSPRETASALLRLLEEQRDCVNELERWRPSQTDLHGECRDLVNQLMDTVGEILEATDNQVTLDGDKVVIADYAKTLRDLREQRDARHDELCAANDQLDYYKADLDAIRATVPNVEGVCTQDLVRDHLAKLREDLYAARTQLALLGISPIVNLSEFVRSQSDEQPKPACHLCNLPMPDGTDGHGLGECVSVCPTCDGSGTAEQPKPVEWPHLPEVDRPDSEVQP